MRPLIVIGLFLTTVVVTYAAVILGCSWYIAPGLDQTGSDFAVRTASIVSIALGFSVGIAACILLSFKAIVR